VLNSEGDRIPQAGIHVSCWFQDQQYRTKYARDQKTDDSGVAKTKLLPTLERIRIWVSAKDHVTLFSGFEPEMLGNLPKRITFRLQRSETIGGKVVDHNGRPVNGATIELRRNSGGKKLDTNDFSKLNSWIAEQDYPIRTDENGQWMIAKGIPTGDDLNLSFIVKHPVFLATPAGLPWTTNRSH